MRKTAIIMQTRMGSTRLPGKVMLPLRDKPMLEHIIMRLKQAREIDEIIVATTGNERDDVIVDTAQRLDVAYFRGSEEDVLSRYYMAAKEFAVDNVVRVTSDCPILDPEVIDDMALKFKGRHENLDYMSNTLRRTFPRGLDAEVFTFEALEKAFEEAQESNEREHVTPYIWQRPELFKLENYEYHIDVSHYRWTVDCSEDFELITKIYDELYQEGNVFLLQEVLALFKKRPELAKINEHIEQKGLRI